MTATESRVALVFASFGHSATHLFMLLYATVVLVLEGEFGMSYAELQWLSVPGFVLFGAAALPAGWLGDRWSQAKMMAVFYFGVGGGAVVTGLAQSWLGLAIGLTLIGLFASIYHPVGIAWLVKHSEKRGRALGWNGLFGMLGTAGAALVAGTLADLVSWRAAFLVPGILMWMVGGVFLLYIRAGVIRVVYSIRTRAVGGGNETGIYCIAGDRGVRGNDVPRHIGGSAQAVQRAVVCGD